MHPKYTPQDIQRFWAKVDKSGECWHWTAMKVRPFGHGSFSHRGRMVKAHRVAYELAIGPIDGNLCVLHRCDVPDCVRPDHLFLGTIADNNRDKIEKGRARQGNRYGEDSNLAKLTLEQVEAIRSRYAVGGISMQALGAEYGIGAGNVHAIVHRRSWR